MMSCQSLAKTKARPMTTQSSRATRADVDRRVRSRSGYKVKNDPRPEHHPATTLPPCTRPDSQNTLPAKTCYQKRHMRYHYSDPELSLQIRKMPYFTTVHTGMASRSAPVSPRQNVYDPDNFLGLAGFGLDGASDGGNKGVNDGDNVDDFSDEEEAGTGKQTTKDVARQRAAREVKDQVLLDEVNAFIDNFFTREGGGAKKFDQVAEIVTAVVAAVVIAVAVYCCIAIAVAVYRYCRCCVSLLPLLCIAPAAALHRSCRRCPLLLPLPSLSIAIAYCVTISTVPLVITYNIFGTSRWDNECGFASIEATAYRQQPSTAQNGHRNSLDRSKSRNELAEPRTDCTFPGIGRFTT